MARSKSDRRTGRLFRNMSGQDELFEKSYEEELEARRGQQVECLGLTFESDEKRREYFLEKLRRKLKDPEFRNIEGFPIGEDEDILALSDPPYYTACPNPWIEDFIKRYGKPYDPVTDEYRREPFAADVSEGKTDPMYNAHAYHTKVPYKAIMHYILHYTEPTDLLFDGFCGTGMAGVAAQMCGDPDVVRDLGYSVAKNGSLTSTRQEHADGVQQRLQIGTRNALISDLSPIATFIASNYCRPFDVAEFHKVGTKLLEEVERDVGWMYETTHSDGHRTGKIDFTVWSDMYACPECAEDIIFAEQAFDSDAKRIKDNFHCPNCSVSLTKDDLELLYNSYIDAATSETVRHPKRKPVLINYSIGKTKFTKKPDTDDLATLKRIEQLSLPQELPTAELADSQMRRVGRMQPAAITRIHHFFHMRPSHALASLWRHAINVNDRRLRHMALFFVEQAIWTMSLLNRFRPSGYSQVNQYLSGVFYVPSQHAEVSPTYVLSGKLKRLVSAFSSQHIRDTTVMTSVADCARTLIPDDSIDYVFTDPPFGENIYYADLNVLLESWHGVLTAPVREAIIDRVRGKALSDYQTLMEECFTEYYRVLKPGRWTTVEFHNSKNSVWNSIQEALQRSGFVIADVRILDKKQGSFQQVTSRGAVKQDLIISAYKPNGGLEERFKIQAGSEDGVWDFVRTHLKQLPVFVSNNGQAEVIAERQNYLLFDRMVAFHVERGVTVPLSAADFYAGLEQRFPPRDGMYFLPDQAAEYDKKRMTVKEILQLDFFVSDEATAIQWLKQQLTKKPQTFQEIHPQFLREIGGWQKHEKLPELSKMLEQNFLRYDGRGEVPSQIHSYLSTNFKELRSRPKDDWVLKAKAKDRWYVPDPDKAGDLERLRDRTLLREFEEYRESRQRRLTVFRLEAVRAGFKKAWQERNYKTIIAVAGKIPETILHEDPKLLMWYDQALTRSGQDN